MRKHSDFQQYVINTTHKLVWVNIEGFLLFLKWKAHEKGY